MRNLYFQIWHLVFWRHREPTAENLFSAFIWKLFVAIKWEDIWFRNVGYLLNLLRSPILKWRILQPSQLPKIPIIGFRRWIGICDDTGDQHHEDYDVMDILKKSKILLLTFDTKVMSNFPLFSKPWFLLWGSNYHAKTKLLRGKQFWASWALPIRSAPHLENKSVKFSGKVQVLQLFMGWIAQSSDCHVDADERKKTNWVESIMRHPNSTQKVNEFGLLLELTNFERVWESQFKATFKLLFKCWLFLNFVFIPLLSCQLFSFSQYLMSSLKSRQ